MHSLYMVCSRLGSCYEDRGQHLFLSSVFTYAQQGADVAPCPVPCCCSLPKGPGLCFALPLGSAQPPSAPQGDFPLKAERVIQSVMAICNALAAVESQEITTALNQMPPCPSRMQPKIQKVRAEETRGGCRGKAPLAG